MQPHRFAPSATTEKTSLTHRDLIFFFFLIYNALDQVAVERLRGLSMTEALNQLTAALVTVQNTGLMHTRAGATGC